MDQTLLWEHPGCLHSHHSKETEGIRPRFCCWSCHLAGALANAKNPSWRKPRPLAVQKPRKVQGFPCELLSFSLCCPASPAPSDPALLSSTQSRQQAGQSWVKSPSVKAGIKSQPWMSLLSQVHPWKSKPWYISELESYEPNPLCFLWSAYIAWKKIEFLSTFSPIKYTASLNFLTFLIWHRNQNNSVTGIGFNLQQLQGAAIL